MSRRAWFLAAFAILGTSSVASAAQLAACDFYDQVLMGSLCQGTAQFGVSVNNDHREIDSSFGGPGFHGTSKTTYNFLELGASASVTPLRWLQLTLGSNWNVQSNSYAEHDSGPFGHYNFSSASQQTYAGFQNLTVLANALDIHRGTARYIVNGYVMAGFVPGTDVGNTPSQANAKWHTQYRGQLEGNGQWRLPDSPYSIVARSGLGLIWGEEASTTVVQPALAVELSNDTWGIAIGPAAYVNILTSRRGGVGNSPDNVYLGGELRAQPFRTVPVPVLRNITAIIGLFHSVGQSAWVNTFYGSSSDMIVNASINWHFYY